MGQEKTLGLAIVEIPGEETSNEWLEPVTDEEYNKLSD